MIEVGEIWKGIKGYEDKYQISNYGKVRSTYRYKKILKPCKKKAGYLYVNLYTNGKNKVMNIHRLVAEAFLNNPNNYPEVNHIDGNKENNNVNNLEWCNHSDNIKHSYVILGRKQKTMKPIYSRNEKGIKKYDSKAYAIQHLKTIGYEKCNYARINVAIKTKGVAYGFRWSEELIDLIEVGDYVNGEKISNVDKINNTIYLEWENGNMYSTNIANDKFIYSIVTKEQFKQIEYRLEE